MVRNAIDSSLEIVDSSQEFVECQCDSILALREGSQIKKLRKFGHMSKLQVGRVFLSHTFSKKKFGHKF